MIANIFVFNANSDTLIFQSYIFYYYGMHVQSLANGLLARHKYTEMPVSQIVIEA